jgi:hypothetical protein
MALELTPERGLLFSITHVANSALAAGERAALRQYIAFEHALIEDFL